MENRILSRNEYVEKYCSKCKNINNDLDLCEIRLTLDCKIRCLNYERAPIKELLKRKIKPIKKEGYDEDLF